MSCSEFEPLLSELVDGGLATEARARVEAHVANCPTCRVALADIRSLRQAARSLPKAVPPEDLWNKVRARVDAATVTKATVTPISARRPWFHASGRTWGLLAAAAVLVVAVSTGLVLVLRDAGTTPSSPAPTASTAQGQGPAAAQPGAPNTASAHAGSANLVESVEMEIQQADLHYQKAIAGLEQVAREGQGSLDTQTAAVLQKNLGIVDQAIRESRAAVKAQPTSDTARSSLFEALRQKVELLQATVTLINQMRKGDQAGAARIVGRQ
jgi:anti-sigma factor RsiW